MTFYEIPIITTIHPKVGNYTGGYKLFISGYNFEVYQKIYVKLGA
jgi:hypothetical protein